jgi:recombinational DNA repair ATPase RecF
MENQTPEQIAQHYKAMLDSVWLINAVIDGAELVDATPEDRYDFLDRNVKHLEMMRGQDFWTTEDMVPVNAAIAAGNAYIQSLAT